MLFHRRHQGRGTANHLRRNARQFRDMYAPGSARGSLGDFVQEHHSPFPFLNPHRVRLQPRQPIRQVPASSWKCVAKMVRQRMAECKASRTAQAMASPSRVEVPRPISSTTTSDLGPA